MSMEIEMYRCEHARIVRDRMGRFQVYWHGRALGPAHTALSDAQGELGRLHDAIADEPRCAECGLGPSEHGLGMSDPLHAFVRLTAEDYWRDHSGRSAS